MKMDPMPTRPTNHDIGRRLVQVHDCLEGHKEANDANFEALGKEITAIKTGLGMQPGQKQTIATNSGRQSFVRTVLASGTSLGAVGGLLLAYRMAVALAPSTWHWLIAINHAILSGKF